MIPTAKEILDNTFELHKYRMISAPCNDSEEAVFEAMIEFAKLHVEACKKAIWEEFKGGVDEDMEEVMFNSYLLKNIK